MSTLANSDHILHFANTEQLQSAGNKRLSLSNDCTCPKERIFARDGYGKKAIVVRNHL